MNTNDPMTKEELDAIQERVANVEFPDDEHLTVIEGEEPVLVWVEYSPHDGSIISGAIVATVHAGPRSAEMFAHAPQDLTDLLAEVERLRARPTVDEEMVERAARALWIDDENTIAFLYEDEDGSGGINPSGWNDLDRDVKGSWLRLARAILDAAHGTGEES